jgi:RNA polymerase sigma-70 factor (ECF subfamily)
MESTTPDIKNESELLKRAAGGDADALGALFARHRERLHHMVELRLDRRLRGRLDADDVLQETYLEVARCVTNFVRRPSIPFFLWLRFLTGRKLQALHRRHLGTKIRDAGREVSLYQGAPEANSASLADQLLGRHTTPSQALLRAELQVRVQEALALMEPIDREMLALRHFEQLTNSEAAHVLELSEAAASNRYVRALKRLKDVLTTIPGLIDSGVYDGPGKA